MKGYGSVRCWWQGVSVLRHLFIALKNGMEEGEEKSVDCKDVQKFIGGKFYLPSRKKMTEELQNLYLVMMQP